VEGHLRAMVAGGNRRRFLGGEGRLVVWFIERVLGDGIGVHEGGDNGPFRFFLFFFKKRSELEVQSSKNSSIYRFEAREIPCKTIFDMMVLFRRRMGV
jgi:hypothetical protein